MCTLGVNLIFFLRNFKRKIARSNNNNNNNVYFSSNNEKLLIALGIFQGFSVSQQLFCKTPENFYKKHKGPS